VSEMTANRQAIRPLLDAATAACDRGDWRSATVIAEAAAAIDPNDPEVIALLDRAGGATATGTRRRLTVMFCDLAGSTEIASVLDPEDTRELLNAYYETCAEIVRRHGGHVAHLAGDGMLIYFGYPAAHEDDVLRAILTGLAITDAVKQLRSPTRGTSWNLQVRVGIHTGLAVISELGSGSWARRDEIVGEAPNLAARVQTAAPTGSVVITSDTLALVRDQVDVESLGAHSLKGINRPVDLYRVVAVQANEDDRAVDTVDNVTVGRERELAVLERAWAEVSERTSYVVISGEPGMGKSHLVRRARSLVGSDGRSLMLRCSALHSNTPLQPVSQLLLRQLNLTKGRGDSLERVTRLAESLNVSGEENLYLLALLSWTPWPADREVPDLQPEQIRERTLALLGHWFDTLAGAGPLLLVVEDLHWADPSTLDLLGRCVSDHRPNPMEVLVTTREDPDSVPGEPTDVVTLRALDEAQCDELIETLTGGRLDEEIRSAVRERGDGVPLYLRELATMLDSTSGAGAELATPSVPPTLNDLLVARLDSFPRQRNVVEALAVLGRPSSPRLIAAVVERPSAEVIDELELLEQAGIVRSSAKLGLYEFHHTLLRDTAYDLQLLANRRALHHRAAEALQESNAASLADYPEELAHHYQLAGEPKPAVTLLMGAALQHAAFAAHAEAIRSFESVLEQLPELDGDTGDLELRARSGLAASLLAARGYTAPEVEAAYDKVREIAVARDAKLEVSGLYGLWAYYHVTGDAQASLETAETLVERAVESGDAPAAAAARAVLGYQLQRVGRPAEAVALLEQGREWDAPEPLFPHHPGIGAGANLALTRWLIGDFAGARTSIAHAVEAAEAMDGPTAHFTRAYTHAFASELFHVAGEPGTAAAHAGRAVEISNEFGFTSWLGAGLTNLKIAEALAGDADAIPTIEYCLNAWRGAGAASNLTQFGLGLAMVYRAADRPQDALATIEQALKDALASQELYLEPELLRVKGEVLDDLHPEDEFGFATLEYALATAAIRGSRALELRTLLSIERRHRDRDDERTVRSDIARLATRLDPSGQDSEKLLEEARALIS
jgi:class 3 adenylate cyclase/tetratricopeptide (TPR) repeat protein